jgi:[ribosomal protein S5]-alanine N-acetyltransferase
MLVRTHRFILRDFQEPDRTPFIAYQMDARYRRLYDLGPDSKSAHTLFDRFLAWQQEEPRQNLQVGIFEHDTGRLCGSAGLRKAGTEIGTAVFGIELTPDDWGRYRLAIDVSSVLVEHGFHDLDLHTIIGSTSSGNIRVERLARRFGAKLGSRRPGPAWMTARGWHEVDWSLTRDDWVQSGRGQINSRHRM